MKKVILRLILVVDVVVIIILLVSIGQRIFLRKTSLLPKEEVSLKEEQVPVMMEEERYTPEVPGSVTPLTTKVTGKRNILFQYRDSRPKKVEIVGDFNNWQPVAMAKGANHIWTIVYQLDPGEYTYKFLIDGKLKKDPYNPRSAPDGYGGESSLLIVKPLGADVRR